MSSRAEKCPICEGKDSKDCHGCDGKGWVTVEDKPKPSETKLVTNTAQPMVANDK